MSPTPTKRKVMYHFQKRKLPLILCISIILAGSARSSSPKQQQEEEEEEKELNELFSGDINDWDYIDVGAEKTTENHTCVGNACSASSSKNDSSIISDDDAKKKKERKYNEELRVVRELFSGDDISDWDWFGSTDKDRCLDKHDQCHAWAEFGECENNPRYMQHSCQTSCDVCISYDDVGVEQSFTTKTAETKKVINQANQYFANEVLIKADYSMVRQDCKNHHSQCSEWVVAGECERNLAYMTTHCPLACRTCLRLDYKVKCPTDFSTSALKATGDLNTLFQNVIMNSGNDVQPIIIHSKPSNDSETSSTLPWIIELNNFISETESIELLNQGRRIGYQDSGAWCDDECTSNHISESLLTRLSKMINIPENNFELFHLVKHDSTTIHADRHDYHISQMDKQYGVRVLSLYISLNDVTHTGGKKFIISNAKEITIQPKLGRVLIWSNVLDDKLSARNDNIILKGLETEEDVQEFGINIWVHNRDFRTAYTDGCA